jgi:hypothetical protein
MKFFLKLKIDHGSARFRTEYSVNLEFAPCTLQQDLYHSHMRAGFLGLYEDHVGQYLEQLLQEVVTGGDRKRGDRQSSC